jgi:hypothetical protein
MGGVGGEKLRRVEVGEEKKREIMGLVSLHF